MEEAGSWEVVCLLQGAGHRAVGLMGPSLHAVLCVVLLWDRRSHEGRGV